MVPAGDVSPVFDRILFPTDGSDAAATVFEHVLALAADTGATVHVLHVADTTHDSLVRIQTDVVDVLAEEGETIVQELADRAAGRGVACETAVLQGGPAPTIVDYAEQRDVDLIVMPTHGRSGLDRLLVGSTTERVLRRARAPVLTVRPGEDQGLAYPYDSVLVPTDGSDCATAALDVGVDVADTVGADLHLLSVIDIPTLGADGRVDIELTLLEESAEEILDAAGERAAAAGVEPVASVVEAGPSVHRSIVAYVESNDVDLLVVGTHGLTGLERVVLGSVTESLVRSAPVPVLAVRAPGDEAFESGG